MVPRNVTLKELDEAVFKQYKKLTEADIKVLVVDDKWMVAIERDIHSEMDRISQRLTQRITEVYAELDQQKAIVRRAHNRY